MQLNLQNFKGIAGWVRWAISEKRVVYLIVFTLMAAGIVSLFYMNKDEFPTFQIKQGLVAGVYPGATAAEVEEQLTKPLEQALFSYKEVVRESTKSVTKDGICYIYVDLNCRQSQKDEVWSKIKLGLQTKKMTLPPGVVALAVLDDFSAITTMLVSMESTDKSYAELQEYADDLCAELRTIPKLAKVNVLGSQEEEIAVTLDREKLSSYGIDPASLLLSYQTSTMSVPAGNFTTDYVNAPIHIAGNVNSEMDVAEKIIYSDPQGNIVRLKDVAEITRRIKSPESFVSYNGGSCLILNIEMRPDNNIVSFGADVDRILKSYSSQLPQSVTLSRISDQPKVVNKSVLSFLRDLLISMLVVIMVMIIMFPLRSALIASSGVPVCTAVALAAMYFAKIDLNTVTLAALIVVLGMIVDDSVITMDGYMDKLSKGFGKIDAACASAKELFMPTFIATAAICTMFFPMLGIIDGYLGDFIKMFPWVITIALMMSLFYAVSVVPSLEVKYIRVGDEGKKNLISRGQDWFFAFIQRIYDRAEEYAFRHPRGTVIMGISAVALGILMFTKTNVQMMPMAARDYFVIEMELENGQGIDQTKSRADSLTSILLADSRVESVTAFVGTGAPRFSATYTPKLPSPSLAQLIVNTRSTKATDSILKEYESKYEHLFPDVLIRFKQMDYQAVEAQIVVDISGGSREDMLDAASKIKTFMCGMDRELKWVHSNVDNFQSSLNIVLDADEASRLGVNKTMLALSLAGTFNGQTISTLWEGDRQLPVNIYTEGINGSMSYETVANQMIPTAVPGVNVPLRQVADITPDWSLTELTRLAGGDVVNVFADLKFGQSQPAAMKKIQDYVKAEIEPSLPEGMKIGFGGLSATNSTVLPQIILSFIAAVFVLFVFLMFHFKKASLAVLTLVLSSLCLFGAFFGLYIFNLDFSITAVLGLVSLVGIIVRNGIIMFEYAEELRFEHGVDVRTAAMEAGKRRMRPIFLTSCTTALGVLPMIISGDQLWMPMGVTICFGTLLSIFLIVLVMPVSYWQVFKQR